MSTPETSSSKTIKNKYSPLCSGISKCLLTPCRQIGLSRKRKTPAGRLSKHSSEDSALTANTSIDSTISTDSYTENNTTPLTHIKLSNTRKRKTLIGSLPTYSSEDLSLGSDNKGNSANSFSENNTTPLTRTKRSNTRKKDENLLSALDHSPNNSLNIITENRMNTEPKELYCDDKKPKKKSLRTFTSEDLFSSQEDKFSCLEGKTNAESVPDPDFVSTKNEEQNTFELKDKILGKKAVRALTNDFTRIKKNNLQSNKSFNIISSDSDDDFVISKCSKNSQENVNNIKSKSIKTTLSEEKLSLERNNSSENNRTKKFKIQLEKLSERDINCVKTNCIDNSTEIKTLSKKHGSNVLDDADFFTSTPEEEKLEKMNIEKKIKTLEIAVKQKRSILENLQRASIYKSKHNIQDLKVLTSIWEGGCAQALKDLLVQLQAHSSIDLNTLLNNMNFPKEVVAKLSLNNI